MGRKKSTTSDMDVREKQLTPLAQQLSELITDANALKEHLGVTMQAVNQYKLGLARPSLENLCKIADFYGVTTDYLLGLSDIPSVKEDIQVTCKTTRLSVEAIEWLKTANPDYIDILNKLLEHGELAGLLLSSMYLYAVSTYTKVKYIDSLTGNERDFDLNESKALIKSETQDSISLVLDKLRSIYSPHTEKLMDDRIRLLKLELEDMKNGKH